MEHNYTCQNCGQTESVWHYSDHFCFDWTMRMTANRKDRKSRTEAQSKFYVESHYERSDRRNLAEYNRYKQIGLGL